MIPFSEEVARQRRQDLLREVEMQRLRKALNKPRHKAAARSVKTKESGNAGSLRRLYRQQRTLL